jgi:hypothetical protein
MMMFRLSLSGMLPSPKHWVVRKKRDVGANNFGVADQPH